MANPSCDGPVAYLDQSQVQAEMLRGAQSLATPAPPSRARGMTSDLSVDEALAGFKTLSENEGIVPALESAHAIAYVVKTAPKKSRDRIIIVNLSGRGDKDVDQAAKHQAGAPVEQCGGQEPGREPESVNDADFGPRFAPKTPHLRHFQVIPLWSRWVCTGG